MEKADAEAAHAAGEYHKDLQKLREDLHPAGERAGLAGYLSGLPGKAPADGDGHAQVPGLRGELHLPLGAPALAEALPGMPGKALRVSPAAPCR